LGGMYAKVRRMMKKSKEKEGRGKREEGRVKE
jgi:hypothetical protein